MQSDQDSVTLQSNWEVRTAGEVCDFIVDCIHDTPDLSTEDTGYYMIRTSDVGNGHIELDTARWVTRETYDFRIRRGVPRWGDIILSREAPLGNVGQILDDKPICLGQRLIHFRPDERIVDARFLLYAFLSPQVQHELHSHGGTGSVVDNLRMQHARELKLPIPPLDVQKRIADILGSLDDKIALNRRLNATLEALARALFKSWFVDFDPVRAKAAGRQPAGMDAATAALFPDGFEETEIGEVPRGWSALVTNDIAEFVLGGDWGVDSNEDGLLVPTLCIRGADIPDLQSGGTGKMPTRYLSESSLNRRRLQPGDLVIEISGGSPTQSTGRPVFISANLLQRVSLPIVCSNFCRMFRPKHARYSQFLYLWLRWLYTSGDFFQYENGTTGIKNLAFSTFCQIHPVVMPADSVLDAFNKTVSPLLNMIQTNGAQSRTLANTRDVLLPRLMSGAVYIRPARLADGGS